MSELLLLVFAIVFSGTYALGLKPANSRCSSLAEFQLFSGCLTAAAAIGSFVSCLVQGKTYLPWSGILTAVCFGIVFSFCVFTNLKALQEGPVSLTVLIINFSLVFQLVYSFIFRAEPITLFRVIGILLLFVCMFLFSNPSVSGEKVSARWLISCLVSMVLNGALSIIAKIYALETKNAYSSSFLMWGYLFATVTSLALALFLNVRLPREKRIVPRRFFTPVMIGLILFVGLSNFGLNFIVVLLAVLMDGAIVYPAVQGGGPIIAAIGSRVFFHEKISWKKAAAILLGALAIVFLNL